MKSWHLDRRTFLRGVGVSLALPWLEGMSWGQNPVTPTRRMGFVFFPYGVPMPPDGHAERLRYGWFPVGSGRDYRITETHRSLEPFRDQLTYFGGLSHPLGRRVPGHKAGDVYLTGADISGTAYRQSVSIDQVAAARVGDRTRFPSLVFSSSGGVNHQYRSTTLSYDRDGRPIPSEHRPRVIFNRLFNARGDEQRSTLSRQASILDAVRSEAESLNNRLGARDRAQLDQYLSSVREAEQRVERAERWLASESARVDPSAVNLEVGPEGPRDFIRSMFDLLTIALQTDNSRIFTYQMGGEVECVSNRFPQAIGLRKNAHAISHERTNYQQWSTFSRFLTEQFAYFLQRLRSSRDGDATLLDNTMILYGCCTSITHVSRNYPLILAGGNNLGIRHGQFREYPESVPLSNLFVTMLDRMQVPVQSFKDSTGELRDVLA